jgi:predicted house-cleaning noncanonical NTP pyrophosphatase (MazG superfamily)
MPRFILRKLVRDKIVDYQINRGQKPDYRILDAEEYVRELARKIAEEAQEIPSAPEGKYAEELADVQQAVDDLREKLGVSSEEVAQAQAAKNKKSGAFKKGLYVDTLEVPDGDEWVEYYRKEPDRFPEI